MKRYFFLLIVGGILTVGGQFALSLGVHPDRVAIRFDDGTVPVSSSLAPLLQGCLGLVLGSVLAVTGMLGLAECYQREAGRLEKLLNTKLPVYSNPESDVDSPEATRESIAVASSGDLGRYNRYFWHAYLKSAAALCLFMACTLALTATFVDASFLSYLIILTSGTSIIGLVAAAVGLPGLKFIRRAHADLVTAADVYADQPELPTEVPEPIRPSKPWRLPRRRPVGAVSRRFSVQNQPSQVTVRHYD